MTNDVVQLKNTPNNILYVIMISYISDTPSTSLKLFKYIFTKIWFNLSLISIRIMITQLFRIAVKFNEFGKFLFKFHLIFSSFNTFIKKIDFTFKISSQRYQYHTRSNHETRMTNDPNINNTTGHRLENKSKYISMNRSPLEW